MEAVADITYLAELILDILFSFKYEENVKDLIHALT